MGKNPSHFKECGPECPVENVSWDDAQAFLDKLNRQGGDYEYRLPTEAQWEYACRAGTTTRYYTGPLTQRPILIGPDGMIKIRDQKLIRLVRRRPMPLDCMTCTATSGSGVPTGLGTTRRGRWRIRLAPMMARPGEPGRVLDHRRRGLPLGVPESLLAGLPGPDPRLPRARGPGAQVVKLRSRRVGRPALGRRRGGVERSETAPKPRAGRAGAPF